MMTGVLSGDDATKRYGNLNFFQSDSARDHVAERNSGAPGQLAM